MSKRAQIFDAINGRLAAITAFRSVLFGTFEPSRVDLPAASVIPAICTRNRASKTHDMRDLDLAIQVVVDETHQSAAAELEELLELVTAAINEDRTWNGLASDFQEGATRWLFRDEHYPRAGADIECTFHYEV